MPISFQSENSHSVYLNNYPDMLFHMFRLSSPGENIRNAKVCKLWLEIASKVAKEQLIEEKEDLLKKSMEKFLLLSGLKFEDVTPGLQRIKQKSPQVKITTCFELYKIQDLLIALDGLTEKHAVCLAGCFIVDPQSPNAPTDRVKDLLGKAFAEFHYIKNDTHGIWGEHTSRISGKNYLPVELFDFQVNENKEIVGEINKGTSCFSLKGKLVELIVIEGNQSAQKARYILNVNRTTANVFELTPESDTVGKLWSRQIYIPRLDATAPIKE